MKYKYLNSFANNRTCINMLSWSLSTRSDWIVGAPSEIEQMRLIVQTIHVAIQAQTWQQLSMETCEQLLTVESHLFSVLMSLPVVHRVAVDFVNASWGGWGVKHERHRETYRDLLSPFYRGTVHHIGQACVCACWLVSARNPLFLLTPSSVRLPQNVFLFLDELMISCMKTHVGKVAICTKAERDLNVGREANCCKSENTVRKNCERQVRGEDSCVEQDIVSLLQRLEYFLTVAEVSPKAQSLRYPQTCLLQQEFTTSLRIYRRSAQLESSA